MMDWLTDNSVWILLIAAFVGMHLFGHGSHSGHGSGHGRGRSRDGEPDGPTQSSDIQTPENGQQADTAAQGRGAGGHKH